MNRTFAAHFMLTLFMLSGVLAGAQHNPHHRVPSGDPCGMHCGTERWAIKTLTDSNSADVAKARPTDSSVSELTSKEAPARLPQNSRVAPIENQQFTIKALLIAWKEEAGAHGDHDFHLVLADPQDHSKTMIAEVPSPQCASACASASVDAFTAARQALTTELGAAPQAISAVPVVPPRLVTVTGVGFFDFDHGQDGLAFNCIEIHPVLSIAIQGKQGTTAIPFQKGANHTCGSAAISHSRGRRHKTHGS